MQLMQWRRRPFNPFNPLGLVGLQDEINRMFEEFSGSNREQGETLLTPALDIKEDEQYLTVTVDLPGVDQKDVEISLQDNVLTIKGEKRSERQEKKDSYRCVERTFGSFERRVQLPSEVDSEQAEATMNNGVLTLRLPRVEESRSKSIPIRSGTGSQEQRSQALSGNGQSSSTGQSSSSPSMSGGQSNVAPSRQAG